MTDRLYKIFNELESCKLFGDVGCDHGYVTEKMLKDGKCENAVVSDISSGSLDKAKKLLLPFGNKVTPVLADGIPKGYNFDEVLIAGMGGDEIIKILSSSTYKIPLLVLQPMKRSDKVREYLISAGYKIICDYTFSSGKFYDIIKAKEGVDALTEEEIKFGRDNLKDKPKAFMEYLTELNEKLHARLNGLNVDSSAYSKLQSEIKTVEGILNES